MRIGLNDSLMGMAETMMGRIFNLKITPKRPREAGYQSPGVMVTASRLCRRLTFGLRAPAQVSTIRPKLLKIGAMIVRNSRRLRFLLSYARPYQDLFRPVAARTF